MRSLRLAALPILALFVLPMALRANGMARVTLRELARQLSTTRDAFLAEELRMITLRTAKYASGSGEDPTFDPDEKLLIHYGCGLNTARWIVSPAWYDGVDVLRQNLASFQGLSPEARVLNEMLFKLGSPFTKVIDAFGASFDKYLLALGTFRVRIDVLVFLTGRVLEQMGRELPISARSTESTEEPLEDAATLGLR